MSGLSTSHPLVGYGHATDATPSPPLPARSLLSWRGSCSCARDRAVDRGPRDGEQLLKLADGVLADAVELDEVRFLGRAELGLLAA